MTGGSCYRWELDDRELRQVGIAAGGNCNR